MTSPSLDTVLIRSKDVPWRIVGATAMLLDVRDGNFFKLNETALCIWDALDGQHSLRQIAGVLTERYQVTMPEAQEDVASLAESLCAQGFARPVGASPPSVG